MMRSLTSTYSQMIDDTDSLNVAYDVLAGRWPEKYNEMVIVLSEANGISDYLIYSLGLRDTEELSKIVTKIMNGETAQIDNEPMTLTYDDLMNVELKLIMPSDVFKYNEKYDAYEDMSENKEYMENLYTNATILKIVGVVTAKEGITSLALTPGVSYRSELIDYIIDYAKNTDIVKKQLANDEIDVFSGSRFDEQSNNFKLDFNDLVSIDTNMLKSAFNIKIDEKTLEKQTQSYVNQISDQMTKDLETAKQEFKENLSAFAKGLINNINEKISKENIDRIVEKYMNEEERRKALEKLQDEYVISKDTFKKAYSGLLKTLLQIYIDSVNSVNNENKEVTIYTDIINQVIEDYINNPAVDQTAESIANAMIEAWMKKMIVNNASSITNNLASSLASSFKVDEKKIANAFKLKMSEDELSRVMTTILTKKTTTAKSNLISLGYQAKEEPTYISF